MGKDMPGGLEEILVAAAVLQAVGLQFVPKLLAIYIYIFIYGTIRPQK